MPGPIFREDAGVGRDSAAFSSLEDVRIQVGERNDSGLERFTGRDSPIKLATLKLLPDMFCAKGLLYGLLWRKVAVKVGDVVNSDLAFGRLLS
jgi:hypothetical protein